MSEPPLPQLFCRVTENIVIVKEEANVARPADMAQRNGWLA